MGAPAPWRWGLLLAVTAAGLIAAALVAPIAQDPGYHAFADRRTLLGVPNALNVLSNAGFLLVGLLGLRFAARRPPGAAAPWRTGSERAAFAVFFLGVALTGLGSAYYHWAPDHPTLFWDRLPLTIAFMGFFASVLGERLGPSLARPLLPALLGLGVGSVVYWRWTEAAGAGDLRPYALVQFLPMVLIPLLLWLFPAAYTRTGDVLVTLGWYGLGKVAELADRPLFELGGVVSGHTVKHLLTALAAGWILWMLARRRPLPTASAH